MAHKVWLIELDGVKHTVGLDFALFSNQRAISVDSNLSYTGKSTLESGSIYDFKIEENTLSVIIYPNLWFTHSFDLIVNGISMQAGRPIDLIQRMPLWTWVFVLACVLLFVLTLGRSQGIMSSTIEGGLIGLTVGYCNIAAKNPYLPIFQRIGICAAATALCWLIVSP